jgi:hypothetical protein
LFALAVNINLNERWQLSPNVGFNYMPPLTEKEDYQQMWDMHFKMVTAGLILGYTPNPCLMHYPDSMMLNNKMNRIDIAPFASLKKFEPKDGSEGEYYHIWGVSAQWSIKVCNLHALTVGSEVFYDGATDELLKDQPGRSPWKMGILVGHEFRWGKIMFGQQVGGYVMNHHMPISEDFHAYARLGLDYRITDFFFIGTSLKTRVLADKDKFAVVTDFVDVRIGYSF